MIVEFKRYISPDKADGDLAKRIIAHELPGVFNWVMEGLSLVLKNRKYITPQAAEKARIAYRTDTNSVLSFIKEEGIIPIEEGQKPSIKMQEMYDKYRNYCIESGHRHFFARTQWKKEMEFARFKFDNYGNGGRVYIWARRRSGV